MKYSGLFPLIAMFFWGLACSTFSANTSSADDGRLSIVEDKPLPVLRLVPVRPAGADPSVKTDENGCFQYIDEYAMAVPKVRKKVEPTFILEIANDFLRKQYGKRAIHLIPNWVEGREQDNAVILLMGPIEGVSLENNYTRINIGETAVTSATLCVYDFLVERESQQFCPVDKAIYAWEKIINSRPAKKRKKYEWVDTRTKYVSLNPGDQLVVTPFWEISSSSIDDSEILVNQITCEVLPKK